MQLESLFRLEQLSPDNHEMLREQGVYRGLRAVVALLEEMRKRQGTEDEDEDL